MSDNAQTGIAKSPLQPVEHSRVAWVDCAKGIGIILVVVGHVLRGLMAAGLAREPIFSWVDYALYLFHMPLFFLLSGLFFDKSFRHGSKSFFLGKMHLVVFPYFLWSLLQGAGQVFLSSQINTPVGIDALFGILWVPIGQFWFLYALFIIQVVSFFFARNILLLSIMAVVAYSVHNSLPALLNQTTGHFVYFVLGIALSRHQEIIEGIKRHITVALVCATAGYVAAAAAIAGFVWLQSSVAVFIPAVSGIVVVLAVSMAARGHVARILAEVGARSMTIFVLHIFAGSGIRVVLVKLGVVSLWVHLPAGVLAGVLLSVAFHLVVSRLGLLPWLGLAPRSRRV